MSLWSEQEVEFLRDNEYLLIKKDYDEFYLRSYNKFGSNIAHRLILGVFLVSPESNFDLNLEISKDVVSKGMVDYELFLRSPYSAGDVMISSGRMSGNPDDFSVLDECKKTLRLLKFDESTIRKILNKVNVEWD